MTDVLVCTALTVPLLMADNKVGTCDVCGVAVQYRPHAHPARRICSGCFAEVVQHQGGPHLLYTTQAMLDDYKAFLKGRLS